MVASASRDGTVRLFETASGRHLASLGGHTGGNLLLGVPFGVLLPVLAPKARGLLRVLIITAVVMVLVELAQGAIVEGRSFDIDDVIMNTTGALLGWLLVGRRMGKAVHRPRLRRRRDTGDTAS